MFRITILKTCGECYYGRHNNCKFAQCPFEKIQSNNFEGGKESEQQDYRQEPTDDTPRRKMSNMR